MLGDDAQLDEGQVDRIYLALTEAKSAPPFRAAAEIGVLVDELVEWLEDDRQWVSANGWQWVSLFDDLRKARETLGSDLGNHLSAGSSWDELEISRTALKKQRKWGPDPAIRRRLERAVENLAARLSEPAALTAAWADLVASATFESAVARARSLFLLAERQGHDPGALTLRLREILADNLITIRVARGESRGAAEPRERAGLTPPERVELAGSVLPESPRRGETVVWLKYALAAIGPDLLRVGDAVSFYRQDYLREALEPDPSPELPPELQEGTEFGAVGSLVREREVERDVPHVIVRVALGDVFVAESLRLAEETAELIVSLATLHGADPSIWVLTKDHVKFVDGRESGSSMHAPDVVGVSLDQRSAIAADPMPEVFETWATELEPRLPICDPGLRRAARLALWLRRARQSWEPGRLVLCDRVFEQVAGWAGVIDRRTFIHEYLRLAWAFGRVRMELRNSWAQVAERRLAFDHPVTEEDWETIRAAPEIEYESLEPGWRVNLRGVLLRLDFILARVEPASPLHERLSVLHRRMQSGAATAHWIGQLLGDFDALEGRARRLRNSLVHGGPLSDESARSVMAFVDWLAAEALYTSIKGFLDDGDLIGRFLDRRTNYETRLVALHDDQPPADVLFWEGD